MGDVAPPDATSEPPGSEITQVLASLDEGDPEAADRLMALVYAELRRLASGKLRGERRDHTLQTTALVHETYLRLFKGGPGPSFTGRREFFGAAATAMRRILIDSARRKRAQKRGGGRRAEPLGQVAVPEPDQDLLALDEALSLLAARDPQKARLVELRYFAGLSGDEAAAVLGISPTTADRHWAYARAWLKREMGRG